MKQEPSFSMMILLHRSDFHMLSPSLSLGTRCDSVNALVNLESPLQRNLRVTGGELVGTELRRFSQASLRREPTYREVPRVPPMTQCAEGLRSLSEIPRLQLE